LDPGSEIRDPGWVKIRIQDKHPGSARLVKTISRYRPFKSQDESEEETPSPALIVKSRQLNKRVALNVGGVR
jgi:hypothetical protein